jgi:hypothetical protein
MDLGDDVQCFGCLMMFVCLSLMWIFKGYKGAQAPKVCLACANLGAESSGFFPQRGGEIMGKSRNPTPKKSGLRFLPPQQEGHGQTLGENMLGLFDSFCRAARIGNVDGFFISQFPRST